MVSEAEFKKAASTFASAGWNTRFNDVEKYFESLFESITKMLGPLDKRNRLFIQYGVRINESRKTSMVIYDTRGPENIALVSLCVAPWQDGMRLLVADQPKKYTHSFCLNNPFVTLKWEQALLSEEDVQKVFSLVYKRVSRVIKPSSTATLLKLVVNH